MQKNPINSKRLKEIAKHGTVNIKVGCLAKGFQITGYFNQPPQKFDLRGGQLEDLIQQAEELQNLKT